MGRSGYDDGDDGDDYPNAYAMYRGRVASATRGRRGQRLLRECLAALDAMPEKVLITEDIVADGDVCTLGGVFRYRGIPDEKLGELDPEDHDRIGMLLDVAPCLIAEIEYVNDEAGPSWPKAETPQERWARVRRWIVKQIVPEPSTIPAA